MRPFDDRRARVHDLTVARAFIVRWTARDPAPANAAKKKMRILLARVMFACDGLATLVQDDH